MKVVAYVRVSTDQQEASGLGLEAQEAKIKSYCGLYDLDVIASFQDAASGKSLKRDGLIEALSALSQGQAEGLIVAKLDRLTRSVGDLGALLEDYFSSRFSLFVVAEQVDTRTAAGRLVLNLLTSVAQWERETIGERTRDALKAKRNRGEKTGGGVPFGFSLNNGMLEEEPQEQAVIRQVKALRLKGFGYKRIAAALNEEGFTTKTGKHWSHVLVRKLLKRVVNE